MPGWNSEAGAGAVTANVALAVWPPATDVNVVVEEGVTVHPDGAGRLSRTSRTGPTPLSAKVSVTVAGWPPISVAGPVTESVVAGGRSPGCAAGLIRSRATPCEATSAEIAGPLSVRWCVHRLSSR